MARIYVCRGSTDILKSTLGLESLVTNSTTTAVVILCPHMPLSVGLTREGHGAHLAGKILILIHPNRRVAGFDLDAGESSGWILAWLEGFSRRW